MIGAHYLDKIAKEAKKHNYRTNLEYLEHLFKMDEDNMHGWEKQFIQEVNELESIKEDIKAFEKKMIEEFGMSKDLPPEIRSPKVKKMFLDDMENILKYRTIDIRDTILIPQPPNEGPTFDERLRIATKGKIDDFLEDERSEFKKNANLRIASEGKDINDKDDDLIRRMNVVAQAVKVEGPPLIPSDTEEIHKRLSEGHYPDMPQDHRILVDDIYRVLHLNNQNPERYNIKFWSEHFKIAPSAIRNVFNHVGYPIFDEKTKHVIGCMQFIDIDIERNKSRLKDVTREDYIAYLEEDFYRRVDQDNKEMQEALGQGESMRQLFITEPIISQAYELDTQVKEAQEKIIPIKKIEDVQDIAEGIMEQLDEEIRKYQEMHENEKSKRKNEMKY